MSGCLRKWGDTTDTQDKIEDPPSLKGRKAHLEIQQLNPPYILQTRVIRCTSLPKTGVPKFIPRLCKRVLWTNRLIRRNWRQHDSYITAKTARWWWLSSLAPRWRKHVDIRINRQKIWWRRVHVQLITYFPGRFSRVDADMNFIQTRPRLIASSRGRVGGTAATFHRARVPRERQRPEF